MKLFHWKSEALKRYARGDILAIGSDVEEARANARAGFEKKANEKWADMFRWLDDGWEMSEDDREERDQMLEALELDILAEPTVGTVFFINGGE